MTIIGITGRSGSGKTALTAYLASKGYPTIDCDRIAGRVIEKGSPCLVELAKAFGSDVLNSDGSLDRAKLSARAFEDKKHQRLLNSITHPYINKLVIKQINLYAEAGEDLVFIDVPLLVDYPLEHYCDKIVVVKADEKKQLSRLVNRGMTYEQAKKRLATQHSSSRLSSAADYIISNNTTTEELHLKAEQLLKKIATTVKKNKGKPIRRRRIPHGLRRWFPILLLILLVPIIGLTSRMLSSIEQEVYRLDFTSYVDDAAKDYDLDRYLIFAFIHTESGFDPEAVSNVGARGLMQITEDTFDWIQLQIDPGGEHDYDDMFDPEVNIRFGSYYISRCLDRYSDDISTAAAAYHSGWGTVDGLLEDTAYSSNGKTLDVFPFEQMNHYVDKINTNYENYLNIYNQ